MIDYDDDSVLDGEDGHRSAISELMMSCVFLGTMGAMNALVLVWLLPIWDAMGWETLEWPTPPQLNVLLLNACADSCLTMSIVSGTIFTSPLIITVGSLTVVPVSVGVDAIVSGSRLTLVAGAGVALLIVGVAIILVSGPAAVKYGERYSENEKDPLMGNGKGGVMGFRVQEDDHDEDGGGGTGDRGDEDDEGDWPNGQISSATPMSRMWHQAMYILFHEVHACTRTHAE